jgi:hypothetical protein
MRVMSSDGYERDRFKQAACARARATCRQSHIRTAGGALICQRFMRGALREL